MNKISLDCTLCLFLGTWVVFFEETYAVKFFLFCQLWLQGITFFYSESYSQTTRLCFYFLTQPKRLFFLGFWCRTAFQWQSWSRSYGIYLNSCLCNQCVSPLRFCVRGVLDTTLCDKVCQCFVTGRWFSPSTLVSSTNTTEHCGIPAIVLTVALNTIQPKPNRYKDTPCGGSEVPGK